MPIYEYACPKCGVFDVMQKISEKPLRSCPTCKAKVTKQMSNPAFHLKGSGWYITDYARKGGGGSESSTAKSDSPSTSESSSSDSTASGAASGESGSGSTEKPKSKAGGKKNQSKAAA
jgi:putative FmdB family regulatory protein